MYGKAGGGSDEGGESLRFSPRSNRAGEIKWMPWGEEAFRRAEREGKPVLLSISAVWCHWCHVMDETIYSDEEVIELVNSLYVPVRVDNDRNPDINRRYNQRGWPTTAFLSSRGSLLAGATYIPPETMRKALRRISELFRANREALEDQPPVDYIRPRPHKPLESLDHSTVEMISSSILASWDRGHGGLGLEPKFPHPEAVLLALHMYRRGGGGEYLEFALHYLRAMARNGLRDRVEGGFFRYSVTRDWSLPHYEKMLDDNARLLTAYLRAYGATGEGEFLEVAKETASYIHRILSDGDHLFFGSQDADEGYYALDAASRVLSPPPPVDKTVYLDLASRAASALLGAGAVLGRGDYRRTSLRFLEFAWKECYRPEWGMAHYHDGVPRRWGLLNDQVETALALQTAFSWNGDSLYLKRSGELLRLVERGFLDGESGLLLDALEGFQPAGLRPLPAELTTVSRTAEAMLRQTFLSGEEEWRETGKRLLSSIHHEALTGGYSASSFALVLDLLLEGPMLVKYRRSDAEHGHPFFVATVLSPDHRALLLPTEEGGEGEGSTGGAEICGEHACYLHAERTEEVAVYLGVRAGIIEGIFK